MPQLDTRSGEISLHGHRVTYRTAGSGPLVVLIHGIAGRSEQWAEVMDLLAEHYTVLAPDLLGHGESAKPRGDYSLGAFALGPILYLSSLYLNRVFGVSQDDLKYYLWVPPAGWEAGYFFWGWAADRYRLNTPINVRK